MIMNISSVRDYKKKVILISLMRQNKIDIPFLQEIFLTDESDFYISISSLEKMVHSIWKE